MSQAEKLKKKAADFEAKRQTDKAIATNLELFRAWEDDDGRGVDVALYNRVGDMLIRAGNVGDAMSVWEKAVDFYSDGGFHNNAIALCNKILRHSPGRASIYYKLGRISAQKGFPGEAKKNYLEYAERMQKSGKLDEAFRALKEFADLSPADGEIREMLADQFAKLGRKDEAIEQLQLLYERQESIGDTDAAAATMERLRAIDPAAETKRTAPRRATDRSGLVFIDVDEPIQPPPSKVKSAPAPPPPPAPKKPTPFDGLTFIDLDAPVKPRNSVEVPAPPTIPVEPAPAPPPIVEEAPLPPQLVDEAPAPPSLIEEFVAPEPPVEEEIALPEPAAQEVALPELVIDAPVEPERIEIETLTTEQMLDEVVELPPLDIIPTTLADETVAASPVMDDLIVDDVAVDEISVAELPVEEISELQSEVNEDVASIADAEEPLFEEIASDVAMEEAGAASLEIEEVAADAAVDEHASSDVAIEEVEAAEPVLEDIPDAESDAAGAMVESMAVDVAADDVAPADPPAEQTVPPEPPIEAPARTTPPPGPIVDTVTFGASFGTDDESHVDELPVIHDPALSIGDPGPVSAALSSPEDMTFGTSAEPGFGEPTFGNQAAGLGGDTFESLDMDPLTPIEFVPPQQTGEVQQLLVEGDLPAAADKTTEEIQGESAAPAPIADATTPPPEPVVPRDEADESAPDTTTPSQSQRDAELEESFADLADIPVSKPRRAIRPTMSVLAQSVDLLRGRVDNDPDNWQLRRELGEALLEDGERNAGVTELEVAMAGFEHAGDLESATSVADVILRLNPMSVRHHQKRVEFAFRMNDRPHLIEAYLQLADALFREGQAEKAKVVYRRVLDLAPDDSRAIAALTAFGETIAPPQRPSGARPSPAGMPRATPAYGRPLTPRPTPPAVRPSVPTPSPGATQRPGATPTPSSRPQPVKAETPPPKKDDDFVDLEDWLKEDEGPKSTRMVVEEKKTGDEDADFNDMLRKFKQGVAQNVDEEDHESHYDLGVAYKEMGLVQEAIAEFQKALRGPKHRVRTYEALGQCFIDQGQHQVASTLMQGALKEPGAADDQLIGVFYLLGNAAEAMNRPDEAVRYYQRVFAVDINFRDVQQRMRDLERAPR